MIKRHHRKASGWNMIFIGVISTAILAFAVMGVAYLFGFLGK